MNLPLSFFFFGFVLNSAVLTETGCDPKDLLAFQVPHVAEAYRLPAHQRDWTVLVTEENLFKHGLAIAHASGVMKHGGHLAPTCPDVPRTFDL